MGEITPEYQLLPPPAIAAMRDAVGEDARILLIRRDPVDRFLSSCVLRESFLNPDFDPGSLDEDALLEELALGSPFVRQQQNSDYDDALRRYREVFPRVMAVDLPDLAQASPSLGRRLGFLDVPFDTSAFADAVAGRVNQLPEFQVSPETRAAVARGLQEYIEIKRALVAQAQGDHHRRDPVRPVVSRGSTPGPDRPWVVRLTSRPNSTKAAATTRSPARRRCTPAWHRRRRVRGPGSVPGR